jgi:hypothetical protein
MKEKKAGHQSVNEGMCSVTGMRGVRGWAEAEEQTCSSSNAETKENIEEEQRRYTPKLLGSTEHTGA